MSSLELCVMGIMVGFLLRVILDFGCELIDRYIHKQKRVCLYVDADIYIRLKQKAKDVGTNVDTFIHDEVEDLLYAWSIEEVLLRE